MSSTYYLSLVEKSLALIAERERGEPVRYRLLEPIRQYALDRLRETEEETIIRDRHLAYSIEFAEQLEPKIKGNDQLQWLKRLDKEHDNLRAALAWSAQLVHDSVSGLRLAQALHVFWQRRSNWSEGRRWLQQAIAIYDSRRELQTPIGDRYLAQADCGRRLAGLSSRRLWWHARETGTRVGAGTGVG